MICYIGLCQDSEICEDVLFCKQIEVTTTTTRINYSFATTTELFKITNDAIPEFPNLQWKNCVAIYTDEGQAISDKYNSLQALIWSPRYIGKS